jgi:hypothetical protein
MMALFEGYDDAHGTHGDTVRNPDKHDKLEIKGTARTIREPVTEDLWEQHLSGERPIGIIPIRRDNTCRWGCIDVDRYDIDHGAVVKKLNEERLPLMLCRTKSGGAHLFLFVTSPVPAAEIQAKLRDLAAHLGFGGSEIFPKQTRVLVESGDLGNWLNMPYYRGDETDRYCVNEQGRGLTLRQFLARSEAAAVTPDEMISLRASSGGGGEFRDGPPCLQHLTTTGFPEGTRNNGLFALGTFLKKKHPDRWEQMIEEMNQKHFSPPLPATEVLGIVKNLRTKDYKYKCSDMPLANHCNAGLCRTRKFGVGMRGTLPVMGSLSVVQTDEPTWFLDVGGERIELSTDELQQPSRFQRKCMEAIHVVVPIMKKETWDQTIQGLMENLTVIEAPPEVSLRGQLFEHIETFCTDRQQAQTKEELILGKAWHDETGRVYFRIRDIQEYLEKVKFRGMTRTQITNRIREWKGGQHFFNIKGRGTNVFWLPGELFETQEEEHELPQLGEEVI